MKKFLKIAGIILLVIVISLIGFAIFLQTDSGKIFVRKQVVSYLEKKLKTPVIVDKIDYDIPDMISLDGVAFIDQNKDTLLRIQHLKVDMAMLQLLKNKVAIDKIKMDGLYANIYRQKPDTFFNYDYIIQAFVGVDTSTVSTPEDTSATALLYDVKQVQLTDIYFIFNDASGGTYFDIKLDSLMLQPDYINPDKMKFDVNEFYVGNASSSFKLSESILPQEPEDTSADLPFLLSVAHLGLDNVHFTMQDDVGDLSFKMNAKKFDGKLDEFDLIKQLVKIDNVNLQESDIALRFGNNPQITTENSTIDTPYIPWKVTADNVTINQVNFKFDDDTEPKIYNGIDYFHLDARDIAIMASDIFYNEDSIDAQINRFTAKEKSGLNLQEFKTHFVYHSKGASLEDLYIKTPQTLIQDNIAIRYNSLDDVTKNVGALWMNMNFKNSQVAINDVLLFTPKEYQSEILPYRNNILSLTGNLNGRVDALQLNDVAIAGLNNTKIKVGGTLTGLPDMDKFRYDLNIAELQSNYNDIASYIPKEVSDNIAIPNVFSAKGTISGTMYKYYPNLAITTSDGNAHIAGMMDISGKNELYDLKVKTQGLNIGKILRQEEQLGIITADIALSGSGFDTKYMNASFNGFVNRLDYNGYSYSKVNLNGKIKQQMVDLTLHSKDPKAKADLTASINLNEKNPTIATQINVQEIDLKALGFYDDTLKLHGNIALNFSDFNPDYPVGYLTWTNPIIYYNSQQIALDSIYIRSSPQNNEQHIEANISNFILANITGKIPLTQIGNIYLDHIDRHFKISDTVIEVPEMYNLDIIAGVKYHPIIKSFIPEIKPFDSFGILSSIDENTMTAKAKIPKLKYDVYNLDSLDLDIDENMERLNYRVLFSQIYEDSSTIKAYNPSIIGTLQDDSLVANISVDDEQSIEKYAFGFDLKQQDSLYVANIFDKLRLNYSLWDVNPNNQIAFGESGYFVKDFSIKNQDQLLTANSRDIFSTNSPIDILISEFRIGTITEMFSADTLLIDGKINTIADISFEDSFPKLNANLNIENLNAYGQTVGNLEAEIHNDNANTYFANATISENGNYINLKGNYFLEAVKGNNLDFKLHIQPLQLKSFEGFSFGQLERSEGSIKGDLDITGTIDEPKIKGLLTTDSLQFQPTQLNNLFKLPNESIDFYNGTITLDDFHIYDTTGHFALLNGTMQTKDYLMYDLNLKLTANKWWIMNSTAQNNELFYGKAQVSTNLDIGGTSDAASVSGNVVVHDSSDFTYANLDEIPGENDLDGIVQFVDNLDSFQFTIDSTNDNIKNRVEQTFQMNLNLAMERKARFNILVDPLTGDMLSAQGLASLNASMDPGGNIALAGTYNVDSGYYELNYNFIKKRFAIQEGSSILFAGDPFDATVNIKAIYNATISPYDLMSSQITDPTALVYYKQRLPFEVVLSITGKPLEPIINFDIKLKEDDDNFVSADVTNAVNAKLRAMRMDVAEMNKQVFGVLIFGRFIGNDPFQSGNAVSMEYYARQSASRFLSQQLNSLADKLVNGVDLSLDLQSSEDYTSGQKENRTELNVSASKRLFNDRLSVTVGSGFLLEGTAAPNKGSGVIPGSISLDYKLVPDGRYSIVGYRKNELQNIIDGYVVETGASFKLNYEYNKFKDLWYRRQVRKQVKEQELQREQKKEIEIELKNDSTKVENNSII